MIRISTIVLAAVISMPVFAKSFGSGPIGSGSIGSGSLGSHSDSGASQVSPAHTFELGGVSVELPDNDSEVQRLGTNSIRWSMGGNQTISNVGGVGDLNNALGGYGVDKVLENSVQDWTYSFGSNGNCLMYVAKNKSNGKLMVSGSAKSEDDIKAILNNIKIVKPVEVKAEAKAEEKKK